MMWQFRRWLPAGHGLRRGFAWTPGVSPAVVLAVLAILVGGCSGSQAASMDELLLRLGDVAPGARLGNDGSCEQGFAFEGMSAELRSWLLDPSRGAVQYCDRQLILPDGGPHGVVIESAVIVFASEGDSAASEAVADGFLAYLGHQGLTAVPPPFDLGETRLA